MGMLEIFLIDHSLSENFMPSKLIFVYDYHILGNSTGKCSESHFYSDGIAVWNYLINQLNIKKNNNSLWRINRLWSSKEKQNTKLILMSGLLPLTIYISNIYLHFYFFSKVCLYLSMSFQLINI